LRPVEYVNGMWVVCCGIYRFGIQTAFLPIVLLFLCELLLTVVRLLCIVLLSCVYLCYLMCIILLRVYLCLVLIYRIDG